MFATGESDEYPQWALPLLTKRMLYQDYGIVFSDMSLSDVLDAMRLRTLENQRERAIHDREQSRNG